MEHGHETSCGCHQHHAGHHGSECCHGHELGLGRHFFTTEEMVKHLEKYLEQLKAEAAGVEEELSRLKS